MPSARTASSGEAYLLTRATASPYDDALKSSDAEMLEDAVLVFRVGPQVETFLHGTLLSLAHYADIVELSSADGLLRLELREGGVWAGHDHTHDDDHDHADQHAHDHEGNHGEEHAGHAHDDCHDAQSDDGDARADLAFDAHPWLDPEHAKVMVAVIVDALSAPQPEESEMFQPNGARLTSELDQLIVKVDGMLDPVRGEPCIVFSEPQFQSASSPRSSTGRISIQR